MATAQVTLKLELFDVQVVADALAVYAAYMEAISGGMGEWQGDDLVPVETIDVSVPLYMGDPEYCRGQANRLRGEIGLRTGEARSPQLKIWGDDRVEIADEGDTAEELSPEGQGDEEREEDGAEGGEESSTIADLDAGERVG